MPKRTLHGVVVSDKQDKTVIVRVERRYTHPMLKKTVRSSKKYYGPRRKERVLGGRPGLDRGATPAVEDETMGSDPGRKEKESV